MAIIKRHFESQWIRPWNWPLNIEIYNSKTLSYDGLLSGRWAGKFNRRWELREGEFEFRWIEAFARRNNSQKPFGRFPPLGPNILISLDYEEINNASPLRSGPRPQIILIADRYWAKKVPRGSGRAFDALAKIAQKYETSGIFVFSPPEGKEFTNWYEQFMIMLSHNENVIEALSDTVDQGIFYYDKQLESETRLSAVIENIIITLNQLHYNHPINFKSRYLEDKIYDPYELLQWISSRKESFGFLRESGDASLLSDLSEAIEQSFTESRFIGAHRSRPADSVALEVEKYRLELPAKILKQRVIKKAAKPQKKKPVQPLVDGPRYLQARIYTPDAPDNSIKNYLYENERYGIEVKIALYDSKLIVARQPFPKEEVFKDNTGETETLQVHFMPGNDKDVQVAELVLPRLGDSSVAYFSFESGPAGEVFTGDIFVYHRNRLIQRAELRAPVKTRGKSFISRFSDFVSGITATKVIEMNIVFCARKELRDLQRRQEFDTSYHYESRPDADPIITGIHKSRPIGFQSSVSLEKIVANLKGTIENAARNVDTYAEDITAANNIALLRKLAILGNTLFVHLVRGYDPEGPIQVVTNREVFIPFDFVYNLNPPLEDAGLCEHAREALKSGKCRECFDKKESPSPHVCPFGFWGFSKVMERYSYKTSLGQGINTDFAVTTEPAGDRQILAVLHKTIHGASLRVDAQEKDMRERVYERIQINSGSAEKADTWKTWSELTTKKSPDSIVLIIHVEPHPDWGVDSLEIGDYDLLPQNHLGEKYIAAAQHPFAIVIGCEVTDVNNPGFDIGSEFMAKGASVVISNFTKISGRQAGRIVMALVEFLKTNAGNEVLLGEIVLKLKQHLLSDGIIAGMALVTYGDADWKIKS